MPLLLFHGDNTLELEEAARKVRGNFEEIDVITLDGPSAPLSALSEASLTAGLFDPERLVVVRNLHDRFKGARKGSDEIEEIRRLFADLAPTTTLLLLGYDMPADHLLV